MDYVQLGKTDITVSPVYVGPLTANPPQGTVLIDEKK